MHGAPAAFGLYCYSCACAHGKNLGIKEDNITEQPRNTGATWLNSRFSYRAPGLSFPAFTALGWEVWGDLPHFAVEITVCSLWIKAERAAAFCVRVRLSWTCRIKVGLSNLIWKNCDLAVTRGWTATSRGLSNLNYFAILVLTTMMWVTSN